MADGMRLRKFQTRNRTGCSTCRGRHVRCDEKRPSCSNCLTGKRACEYPTVEPTLRERRSRQSPLPGQLLPWVVHKVQGSLSHSVAQITRNIPGDPFGTLAVQMPFKSQELFYYFTRGNQASIKATKEATCLDTVVHEPYALRSTLLIAGIHYYLNSGKLDSYESTFLFHKLESIRTINEWVRNQDAASAAVAIRQVLTLGLAECCLGNQIAAETHLNGLMALFDIVDPDGSGKLGSDDVDSELADRYFLMSANFIRGLKSRFNKGVQRTTHPLTENDVSQAYSRMHQAHIEEAWGVEHLLVTISKMPHFLAAPPRGRKPSDIDALPIVEILREMTYDVDRSVFGWNQTEDFFSAGGPTRLVVAVVNPHIASFSSKYSKSPSLGDEAIARKQNFTSSYSGASSAMGLYLYGVVGIWNAGRPMSSRLLCRVVRILRRHLVRDWQRLGGKCGLGRNFWFWKAFVGAMALGMQRYTASSKASSPSSSPGSSPGLSLGGSGSGLSGTFSNNSIGCNYVKRGIDEVEVLEDWFLSHIKNWSQTSNVMTWEEASAVLSGVVWPANFRSEHLAESLWHRAIKLRT